MKHISLGRNLGFGTCLVAVITRDEVIIGADSLIRYDDGTAGEVCKINKVGSFVFATAGFHGSEDDKDESLRISIPQIIKNSIDCDLVVTDNLDKVIHPAIDSALKSYFDRMEPADIDKFFQGLKSHSIEVIVARIENDYPALSSRKLKLRAPFDKIDFEVIAKDFLGAEFDKPERHLAGACGAILWEEGLRPRPLTADAGYVHDSIEIEIKHWARCPPEDRWVGPPIRIIRINRQGIIPVQGAPAFV